MSDRISQGEGSSAAPEVSAEADGVVISRRRLVYAAPVLMSKRLFYRQSGCGKVNPLQRSCVGGAAHGS
jgi:hypothetical protein